MKGCQGSCCVQYKADTSFIPPNLGWLVLFTQYNLEAPGKRALGDRLSALSWPMGTSMRNCSKLVDVGRLIPVWAAPFPRHGILNCGRVERLH